MDCLHILDIAAVKGSFVADIVAVALAFARTRFFAAQLILVAVGDRFFAAYL